MVWSSEYILKRTIKEKKNNFTEYLHHTILIMNFTYDLRYESMKKKDIKVGE